MTLVRFGAKIDFKNEEGIKIAYQILKQIINLGFDSSLFYSHYVDVMLLVFALSRRTKSFVRLT